MMLIAITYSNLQTYQRFVYLSYAAYCSQNNDPNSLKRWDCFYCNSTGNHVVELTFVDNDLDLFGYIVRTDIDIVISFRGTQRQSIENWITNLDFLKTDYFYAPCNCRVHSGFYNGYQAIKDQIVPVVRSLVQNYPHLPLIVTGHSLGGGLSTLCVADLAGVENIGVDSLINFGSPRVGDADFAAWFSGLGVPLVDRVTHYKDIVPHLPLRSFGFNHQPTEIWFTTYTDFKQCDASGEDPTCANSVFGDSIPDHLTYLGVDLRQGRSHGC